MSSTIPATTPSQSAPIRIAQQPDIQYHPSYEKYMERKARRLAENPNLSNTPLPPNFPNRVEGPIVWEGRDWMSEDQWVYRLCEGDLKEIDNALRHFNCTPLSIILAPTHDSYMSFPANLALKISMGYVSQDTFPLPTLSLKLHDFAKELYSGRGFFVLRTIPIDDYSRADLAVIYAGQSSVFFFFSWSI